MDLVSLAQANLRALKANPYPGRGIIVGLSEHGFHLVQIYWIMGRSPNSQNRVFGNDGGRVFTEPADSAKVQNPELIIYNAMAEAGGRFVVSNGCQTDAIITAKEGSFFEDMDGHSYEPDAPNFTPRIAAVCSPYVAAIEMAILRRSPFSDGRDYSFYQISEADHGFGFCLTTYSGDGDPLPAFRGDPLLMPIAGSMEEVAQAFWNVLNSAYRVSLAVKFIDIENGTSVTKIINRFSKVA